MDNFRYIRIHSTIAVLLFSYTLASQGNDAKLANEYYQQGDLNKARELYQDLERDKSAIPLIHSNYQELLIQQDSEYLEKYLNRVVKYYPNNFEYLVDMLAFYKMSDESKYRKLRQELEKDYSKNHYQLAAIAKSMSSKKLTEESVSFYQKSREIGKNPYAYALDVASLYRQLGDKASMTEEYIKYAESNPANINYIKNLFQNILTTEEDQVALEETLISKIQQAPNNPIYPDLLIWLQVQRKDFYSAFVQARAMDNRQNTPGDESMKIAQIAATNQSWDDAIEIYEYVIKKYPNQRNYAYAKSKLIDSREKKLKSQYPIDTAAIRSLAHEYQQFYNEVGSNPTSLDALRNKALLHAFYLSEIPIAVKILQTIISDRRSPLSLIAEAKLNLGDIYLLDGQPWESTLLYSQVEKSSKQTPIGYEAKLKNAKLNYYEGNFSLAKSHLDILKLATTRTTSNDALDLSQIIKNNTVFDTTDQVMQSYADIDLLIFTQLRHKARKKIDSLISAVPKHSIIDELYWLKAQLDLEEGLYDESINSLDHIINDYAFDILADDALYKKGMILQDYLKNSNKAMDIYLDFLKRHPGSRHSAEVRKRIREVRGDT